MVIWEVSVETRGGEIMSDAVKPLDDGAAARAAWVLKVLEFGVTASPLKSDNSPSGDRRAGATKVDAAASVNAEGLKRELAELIARIPPAAGDEAARRIQWVALAADANNKIKAGDLAAAGEAIAKLREALGGGGARQGLREAHDKLKQGLAEAATASQGVAAAIADWESKFAAAMTAGDEAAAREALFELSALGEPGAAAEAASVIPAGIVAERVKTLEEACIRWDGALVAARAGSAPLQAELEEFFPEQADTFDGILDGYWQDLAEAFNAARGLDGAPDFAQILKISADLRARIEGEGLFSVLDKHGIAVRPAFTAALADLDRMLQA
jgi:hypothetical protein